MGIERATTKSEKANESKHIWIHALSIESDVHALHNKKLPFTAFRLSRPLVAPFIGSVD